MDLRRSRDGLDRWTCLTAALALEVCGGLGYTFAVYSQHLKERLDYDQEDLDDIGAAKDFGYSIGIVGGVFYNFIPPWLSITIGSLLHFWGYFMVYTTSAGKMYPPSWMLSLFFAFGVGGDSWIDGVAVMTSVQNFPDYRGTAIGLLKAQVGLSGAFFVTLYQAFLKPSVNAYVFLVAVAPPVVSIALAVFIRPFTSDDEQNGAAGDRRFQVAYGATVMLGASLLVSIFVQAWMNVDRPWLIFFAVAMLLQFILMSLFLAFYERLWVWFTRLSVSIPNSSHSEEMVVKSQLKEKTSDLSLTNADDSLEEDVQLLQGKTRGSLEYLQDPAAFVLTGVVQKKGYFRIDPPNEEALKSVQAVVKQEDFQGEVERSCYTLLQCLQTIDFWLLCLVAITGPGSGLAIINNFGQIGRSLEAHNIELFVGLISIASCFGRLIAGYGSDLAMKLTKCPRPLCLSAAHIVLGIGCLVLSIGYIPLLYVGAVLVGSSYGAVWALAPAIISEVFGLQNFTALYKLVGACGPIGAYILSAKVLGHFYDEEAEYFQHSVSLDIDDKTCVGQQCFGYSLLVLATVCMLGASFGTILSIRNRRLYAQITRI